MIKLNVLSTWNILLQALNHGLVLIKIYSVIKLSQNAWLNPHIVMNTDLRNKYDCKIWFWKYFLSWLRKQFLEKLWKMWENTDIKLVTTERRRNCLVSEVSYHTAKFFNENLLAIEMKKSDILMNKPVCLGLSILELSKIRMYEFWYNYVKLKYDEKEKLCYIYRDSFIAYIKTDDIYKDIANDIERKFVTPNH